MLENFEYYTFVRHLWKKKGIWEKNYAKNFHHVQLNLEKFEGYDLRRNGLRYFPRLCDKHRIVNKSNL